MYLSPMNEIYDFFFDQYADYSSVDVTLEIVAVLFGFISVWYSKKNNVLVFPTGMISTAIFVYLLYHWALLGDMIINGYYFTMSLYGWYLWTKRVDGEIVNPISRTNNREKIICAAIFIFGLFFIYGVYRAFNMWTSWVAYIDTFTTAVFFVGMWLMAKRKIENWAFWIVGNIISIPLYFYKGFTFTSIQYVVFTFLAISGYKEWQRYLDKKRLM